MKKLFLALLVVMAIMTGCSSTSNDKTNEVQDTPEVQEVQMAQEVEVPADAVNEQDTEQDELTDDEKVEDLEETNTPILNENDSEIGADSEPEQTEQEQSQSSTNQSTSQSNSDSNASQSSGTNQDAHTEDTLDTDEGEKDQIEDSDGTLNGSSLPVTPIGEAFQPKDDTETTNETPSNAGIENLHKGMEKHIQDLIDQGILPEDHDGIDPDALKKLREEGFAPVGGSASAG